MLQRRSWLCPGLYLFFAMVLGGAGTLSPAFGQTRPSVEKTAAGVVVGIKDGFLTVTPRADDVFRVTFSTDRSFAANKKSIMAVPPAGGPVNWQMTNADDGKVTVSTSKLQARIDLATGAVSFLDPAGKPIAAEKSDGRSLEAADVQNEKTYHLRQQWMADPNESLYGMGQMQLDLLDIKGYDLDFWQHNGTVVIPFLVSSKGYGILWDNTSFTRFGDLREFTPIPAENLMDGTGKSGGLNTGTFTATNDQLQNPSVTTDIGIGRGGRGNGGGGGRGRGPQANTRWEGQISAPVTGDYQFQAYSNGGIKVWIDNKLVMNHWRQSWLPWYDLARVHMDANQKYPIKVEYDPEQGNTLRLLWKTPASPQDDAATMALETKDTSLWSEVGAGIDYYFCYGPDIDQVIAGYRNVTGKANMLPEWAFGLWQSKDHYASQDESLNIVKEYRKRQAPLDNIVQDWQYWVTPRGGNALNTVGSWTFDASRYPDPRAWTKAIHDEHAHVMISVWGWISKDSIPPTNYNQMSKAGYLLGLNNPQARTFADFFNPDAAKLFWFQLNTELFNKGIDAWWLDASEPDMAGTPTLDALRTMMNPNGMGTGAKMLNGYPIMESKAMYEGQRDVAPDQRVFILTRSAFAGQQRYSGSIWSGDSTSTWTGMEKQIDAGLGYCISGMPYWSMDIGGYLPSNHFNPAGAKDEWDELNTRWFQWGTFVPLTRIHGQGPSGVTGREIFAHNDQTYQAMLKYDKLRYSLMPYIYSLAGNVTENAGTIMRPLVMDFTSDPAAREVRDQYMFGPSLLVNPVYTFKARSRSVYLPPSAGWYEFWTGAPIAPGTTIDAPAPYDSIPLYVKAGSIIPTGPVLQYTTEKPQDNINLYVYTGADAKFILYEDDGVSYGYEKGAFTQIPMTWNDGAKTLTIGKREGSFPGMLNQRAFNVIFVSKDKPAGFSFDAKPDKTVQYTGSEMQVKQ